MKAQSVVPRPLSFPADTHGNTHSPFNQADSTEEGEEDEEEGAERESGGGVIHIDGEFSV